MTHHTLIGVGLVAFAATLTAQGQTATWEEGDVFTSTGANGGTSSFKVWSNGGTFKETINGGGNGYTTGGAFDSAGNLYLTFFSQAVVKKLDQSHPHAVLQTISLPAGSSPESVAFDSAGNFYVGQADGDRRLRKFDAAGNQVDVFTVSVGNPRGTDWVDLLADQRTVIYTSETRTIYRYDLASRTQLANVATLPGTGFAYALRALPPFDLTAGLLVADTSNIKRLDAAGAVVQTYDATGQNNWFSMNLDPNGRSFWAGDLTSGQFFRFNIATGAIEVGPIQATTGSEQLAGIVVRGELSGGNTPPDCSAPAEVNAVNNTEIRFPVTGSDVNAGDIVRLSLVGDLPAGATMTPPLPLTGNPVLSQFTWTPTFSQIGRYDLVFRVRDRSGLERDCPVRINVRSECLLLLASAPDNIAVGNDDMFLLNPASLFFIADVIQASVPTIDIPAWSALQGLHVYGQVIMFNDYVFPSDPFKVSNGLNITLGGGMPTSYGNGTGLRLWTTEPTPLGGRIAPAFRLQ